MKCLSLRQPWASLILFGVKRFENRSWPAPSTLIGQRIAIHASAGSLALRSWSEIVSGARIDPSEGVAVAGVHLPPLASLPRGVILGSVLLVTCQRFEALTKRQQRDAFAEGPMVWRLAEPRWLAQPLACKGALRLWDAPAGLPLD
jgi:hypothetical protein